MPTPGEPRIKGRFARYTAGKKATWVGEEALKNEPREPCAEKRAP